MTTTPPPAPIPLAIEVMTAWFEGHGNDFAQERITAILAEYCEQGLFALVHGLINVAGWATIKAANATEASELDILRDIALRAQG